MKLNLNARKMTWILLAIVLLLAGLVVAGNWKLGEILSSKVSETNQLKTEAQQSDNNLAKAKALEIYESSHQAEIQKAAAIVAESKTYQYQNQIIKDINGFAGRIGIGILGYTFPENSVAAAKQTVPGLKSIPVSISLRSPLKYTDYLSFVRLIESNLTKMQITNISVAPDPVQKGYITTPSIELEVYVK
ncbi:MAG: hypothetical protein EOL90_13180 [Spartobacteria bacterium]|nr:hypothetical protein [Spartobacteria bacterium]NCU30162.1 hypothetical protein [Candidatus Saccharibacteria bacterium]